MRRRVAVLVMGCAAALALGSTAALGSSQRVIVCHYTGDSKTPYHLLETSASGAYNAHYQHHDDIIPPFEHKGRTYSRNWDAAGRAIWNNGCIPVSGTGGGPGGSGSPPPAPRPSAVVGDPSFTG